MSNEVCTEASQSLDPQCCTHNLETRLHWVMCSNKILDSCLFAYDTDIFHTPHDCNSDTNLSVSQLLTTCLWYHLHSSCCGASMASFLHFEKYIIILTPHQPSEASLVGCQWQPMCHQERQMIVKHTEKQYFMDSEQSPCMLYHCWR